jgi:DNA-binding winged helix-turn-helix (wHTH) protein
VLRNMGPRAATERPLHLPVTTESTPTASRWRIADLLLDTRRQRVWRGDAEIPLPKLTYALFVVLVRRCPDVVADEDLMKAVWPGVIVSPETVSQRVKLLRQCLKDDPRAPRYVGRLRSRGYHLVPMAVAVSDEEHGDVESRLMGGTTESDAANAPNNSEQWAANPAARDAVISMLSPRLDESPVEPASAAHYIEPATHEAAPELVPATELFPPDPASVGQPSTNSLVASIRAMILHLRRR